MKEAKALTNIPLPVCCLLRPVGFPNEHGFPEAIPIFEVPDPILFSLGTAPWVCLLAGIIGFSSWPILVSTAAVFLLLLQMMLRFENQICQDAEAQFRQQQTSEVFRPECD